MCTPKNLALLTLSTVATSLSGFFHIEEQIVVPTPLDLLNHLVPVVGFIFVSDQAHHSCIVRKPYYVVGAVGTQSWVSRVKSMKSRVKSTHPCVQGDGL